MLKISIQTLLGFAIYIDQVLLLNITTFTKKNVFKHKAVARHCIYHKFLYVFADIIFTFFTCCFQSAVMFFPIFCPPPLDFLMQT